MVGNTIGKSNRTNFVSKNVAGVGDYNILNKKMTGITIPKGNRFQKFNDLPGPGAYHFSSTISNFNSYRKKFWKKTDFKYVFKLIFYLNINKNRIKCNRILK